MQDTSISAAAMTDKTGGTLAGIQLLRGIAALLVVFEHYVGTSVERGFAIDGLQGAAVGHVGVDIFFVISGFIMEHTCGGKPYRPGDRSLFILRRMIRILPLYWTMTALAFAIMLIFSSTVHSHPTWNQLLMSLLVLPGRDAAGTYGYVITMAWTLTYEFYFYILFCFFLPVPPRTRLLALAALFGFAALAGQVFPSTNPLLGILTNPIVFEFLLGCLLAQLLRDGKSIGMLTGLVFVVVAIGILLLEFRTTTNNSWVRLALWATPAALLVYATVLVKRGRTRATLRSFFVPVFEHIGNISYSLYLSHFFAIAVFVRLHGSLSRHFDISPWLAGAALFGACILVAQICYLLIERPSRAALQARLVRARASRMQAVA